MLNTNLTLLLIQTHSLAFSSILMYINFINVHMSIYILINACAYMDACNLACLCYMFSKLLNVKHLYPAHTCFTACIVTTHTEQRSDSLLSTHYAIVLVLCMCSHTAVCTTLALHSRLTAAKQY